MQAFTLVINVWRNHRYFKCRQRQGRPDAIAAGNIGCMVQIGSGTELPVVHTVELLDWVTGGPLPRALEGLEIVAVAT